jgi:hypothetical protein
VTLSRLDQICFVLGVIAATPVVTLIFNARSLRRYAKCQAADRREAECAERLVAAKRHERPAQERRTATGMRAESRSLAARSAEGRVAVTLAAPPATATGARVPGIPRQRRRSTRDPHALVPSSRRLPRPPLPPTVARLQPHSTQPLRAPLPRPLPPPQPARAPAVDAPRPVKDITVRYVALVATGVSVAATAYFYHRGQLLLYDDELSRIFIARRIFDNPEGFSLAQLGGVWLPWPQLQIAPFVALRSLYFDGLGGSIPSMLNFVGCSVLLYKIVYHFVGRRRAPALAGAAVFVLSPNVLYAQSTALSELGMYLWLLGGVYGVQRFFEVKRLGAQRRYLALAGVSCTLLLLTGYEGWIVTAALLACVVFGCALRGYTHAQVRAWALSFAFFPILALLSWLAYNQVVFGSALYFYDGPYAKSLLWPSAADPAADSYFALIYAPAAAICIGVLIGALGRPLLVRLASAVAVSVAVVVMALSIRAPNTSITTLEDGLAGSRGPTARQFAAAAAYLRVHYHRGLVLAQFFGNEGVLYEAHIPPTVDVYEELRQLWPAAIADPVRAGIRWVVMRTDAIDRVYRSLHGASRLLDNYALVYDQRDYQIYEQRGCDARTC